ncbi:MAG TPA: cytochrome c [Thermodesulfobacteriota bacterium]|nr:cytochrome c [Thermodesulfobacteriota bacterium]
MLRGLRVHYLCLTLILFVAGAGGAFAWPWSTDMWQQPSIKTYEEPIAYPSASVSKDQPMKTMLMTREEFEQITQNPRQPTQASLQRGEQLFYNLCFVCHGKEGKGDGPIIKKGFYPVDLTSPGTQARTDGYIYAYMRYGGKVMMPSYGENVSSEEAWDIVNYVRKLQGKLSNTQEMSK